jgi:hypothetical protein
MDIVEHYQAHWGAPLARLRRSDGRSWALPGPFRVAIFQPAPAEKIFATCGMGRELELHWVTRAVLERDEDVVVILHAVAEYHFNVARLRLGNTVDFGMPWQPGSRATHGLISLPYLFGLELEKSGGASCLWLIPITPEELAFQKEHGLDALEDRFESAQFDYTDPHRLPVVEE